MSFKFTENLSELNKELISLVIQRSDPVLKLELIPCLSLQVVFKYHKNSLIFKSFPNQISLLITKQDYWGFYMLVKRVLIGNGALNRLGWIIMNDQYGQCSSQVPLICFA